jgi:F-type H+-transporting ATPase subunit epsilon
MAATTENIFLEIVTPTGIALRERVEDLTAPSIAGEFGVLPGHLPILAALKTGIVSYHQGGQEKKIAVANGFVEVVHDTAVLLTDYFARKEDVDVVHVRRRMKEVDEALASWDGELADPKRRALIEEGQWLATQLELIGDPPLPVVTEDTRFLAEHARLAQEDVAEALRPDESLTDHDMKQGPE